MPNLHGSLIFNCSNNTANEPHCEKEKYGCRGYIGIIESKMEISGKKLMKFVRE